MAIKKSQLCNFIWQGCDELRGGHRAYSGCARLRGKQAARTDYILSCLANNPFICFSVSSGYPNTTFPFQSSKIVR